MKTKFYFVYLVMLITALHTKTNAQNANTTLSNLTAPTAVNANLFPDKDHVRSLGSLNKSWKNLYLDSAIYLGGYSCFYVDYSNTGTGNNALKNISTGYNNTATGALALTYNTTGTSNTAIGTTALGLNTTGNNNTSVGEAALSNNKTGANNSAFGSAALGANNGNDNAAIGFLALDNNTGSDNVAIGSLALLSDASNASEQVAIGYKALVNLYGGSGNCTAVGSEAGYNNSTGGNNTYLGYHAGNTVTSGSSNTIVGYGADLSSGTYSNATALGNFAVADASNHIKIGNSSVTKIGGQVSWSTYSDARIKNNIQQNVPGLQFINLLKPVTYHYDVSKQENVSGRKTEDWTGKYDIEKIQFTGFIAQDVEAAAKKIGYDFSGVDVPKDDKGLYSLCYSDFVVPLVKAVQELSVKNDSLQKQNNDLENKYEKQQQQIDELKAIIVSNQAIANDQRSTVLSSASLSQNIPNPFSNTTTINYALPQTYSSAKIIVTDKNGNAFKQVNLSGNKGSVNVDASTLSAGTYQYALYVDAKLVDSKQMILSK